MLVCLLYAVSIESSYVRIATHNSFIMHAKVHVYRSSPIEHTSSMHWHTSMLVLSIMHTAIENTLSACTSAILRHQSFMHIYMMQIRMYTYDIKYVLSHVVATRTVPLTLNLTHACVCTCACTRLMRVKVNNLACIVSAAREFGERTNARGRNTRHARHKYARYVHTFCHLTRVAL